MEWKPIETAPKDGWIEARFSDGGTIVVIAEEFGWWEDETGDFTVEARVNPSGPYGLVAWRYLPPDYAVSDYEGTDRYNVPVATPTI